MNQSILQVASAHLRKVKRSGNEDIMAICPFHRKEDGREERDGSFAMNINNGLWYCHSCHARGNLYTFLRDVGIPRADIEFHYKELLEEAEKYCPPPPDPLNPAEPTTIPLSESFLGFFDYCPELLLQEGFPMELLRRFDVGLDTKNSRVTFPLRDSRGKLIGISGRSLDGRHPRYKVYDKEYLAFGLPERKTEKRALLWNYHNVVIQLSFEPDPSERMVIVTEGFKAVMRVAQAGVWNVVGLLGSYMSLEQQWLLERFRCPILLMFDNDEAGRIGQLNAADRFIKTVPRVFAVQYDAPQPSELTTHDIQAAILNAQNAVTWLSQQTANRN